MFSCICYLTYLINLIIRVIFLTCVSMCMLDSHRMFSINLCFFLLSTLFLQFYLLFEILKYFVDIPSEDKYT